MKFEQKQLAKDLYLHTDKSQLEIADILDVDRKTVRTWMKDGQWESMKIAALQAPGIILQNLYNHIGQVEKKIQDRPAEDRCPTKDEVEMLRKLINMTKVIGGRHTGSFIMAYEQLVRYANKKNHDLGTQIYNLADNMLQATLLDKDFDWDEECRDLNTKIRRVEEDQAFHSNVGKMENKKKAAQDTPVTMPEPTPNPTERNSPQPGKMGRNGEFYTSPCAPETTLENEIKPSPVIPYAEIINEPTPGKFPTQNFSAMGNFETRNTPNSQSQSPDSAQPNSTYYATLPPDQRPSPYKEGNIIWVNHINDVEHRNDNFGNPWGELKMADAICRYPGMPKERW